MWKNVIVNFLVLSFIVFSGQYLHYRVNENASPEKTASKVNHLSLNISGARDKTVVPVSISGANQIYEARTYHICGIETQNTSMSNKILPSSIVEQSNLLINTSS